MQENEREKLLIIFFWVVLSALLKTEFKCEIFVYSLLRSRTLFQRSRDLLAGDASSGSPATGDIVVAASTPTSAVTRQPPATMHRHATERAGQRLSDNLGRPWVRRPKAAVKRVHGSPNDKENHGW